MDPISLIRLFRRRWVVLAVVAVLGAAAGYASTAFGSDEPDAPTTTYWEAGQVLRADVNSTFNLATNAPRAVLGEIPATVAEARGVEDPAELGLRAFTDQRKGTLTIYAVAADAETARDVAAAVTDEFITVITDEVQADYNTRLDALRGAAALATDEAEAARRAVRNLENRIPADGDETALSPAQQDSLRLAREARATAENLESSANTALRDFERTDPPPAPLAFLDTSRPNRIAESEYRSRLRDAAQADNVSDVFTAVTSPSAATGDSRLDSPIVRAILGFVLGLGLAVMAVVGLAKFDTRLRDKLAFEQAFGLPVLTEVPTMGRREQRTNVLHAVAEPYSQITEAHRYIRSVLLFARAAMGPGSADVPGAGTGAAGPSGPTGPSGHAADDGEVRVVMVTSAGPGEGKTTTAANLAVMMAEAGYETVLVNCDHRRPRLHEMFGLPYSPETLAESVVPNLHVITDVRRDADESPSKLSERQRTVITNARAQVDVVILDTAPILSTNDALDLLQVTDLVLVVAREGTTTVSSAGETSELLVERMGVPVAGVVVTGVSSGFGDRYYEHSRYGGYYGTPSMPTAAPTPPGVEPVNALRPEAGGDGESLFERRAARRAGAAPVPDAPVGAGAAPAADPDAPAAPSTAGAPAMQADAVEAAPLSTDASPRAAGTDDAAAPAPGRDASTARHASDPTHIAAAGAGDHLDRARPFPLPFNATPSTGAAAVEPDADPVSPHIDRTPRLFEVRDSEPADTAPDPTADAVDGPDWLQVLSAAAAADERGSRHARNGVHRTDAAATDPTDPVIDLRDGVAGER